MAVSATGIYWLGYGNGGALAGGYARSMGKVPLGAVATHQADDGTHKGFTSIAINPAGTFVYWGFSYAGGGIQRLDTADSSVSTAIATGGTALFQGGLAATATELFYHRKDGDVWVVQRSSAAGVVSESSANVAPGYDLAVDDTAVYWTAIAPVGQGGGVFRANQQALATTRKRVVDIDSARALAVGGGSLCVATEDATNGSVYAAKSDGTGQVPLASGQVYVTRAKIADGYCYWAGGSDVAGGYLRRRKLDGSGKVETLATTGVATNVGAISGIAIDESFVYFQGGGAVRRVHK